MFTGYIFIAIWWIKSPILFCFLWAADCTIEMQHLALVWAHPGLWSCCPDLSFVCSKNELVHGSMQLSVDMFAWGILRANHYIGVHTPIFCENSPKLAHCLPAFLIAICLQCMINKTSHLKSWPTAWSKPLSRKNKAWQNVLRDVFWIPKQLIASLSATFCSSK